MRCQGGATEDERGQGGTNLRDEALLLLLDLENTILDRPLRYELEDLYTEEASRVSARKAVCREEGDVRPGLTDTVDSVNGYKEKKQA